jgi:hypothetical protein
MERLGNTLKGRAQNSMRITTISYSLGSLREEERHEKMTSKVN